MIGLSKNTKSQENQLEIEELTSKQVEEAIRAVLYGGQSYQIGSRSLTRANLSELYELRDKLKAEEAQEDSSLLDNCYQAFFDGR